jgi:hypothetical protein
MNDFSPLSAVGYIKPDAVSEPVTSRSPLIV